MRTFYIVTNQEKDKEQRLGKRMKHYIELKGGKCGIATGGGEIPGDTECVFVLGGDGTLIRAARESSGQDIPCIGVNLGHLGYLCELEEENVYAAIDQIMQNSYIIEERMMLYGSPITKKMGKMPGKRALNDIVISRKGAMQLLELIVYINGEYLNTFRADGIIIATPTGSTGYSMSAGGPIVDPKASMILITPINSHNLNAKSIVVGAEDDIMIEMRGRQTGREERAEVNFDGEQSVEFAPGDSIAIHASEQKVKILKLSQISFLEILRKKMRIYA